MTKFEEAVKIIAEDYREECEEHEWTIREAFKCWQCDTEDLQAEFLSILNYNKFDGYFTDDCEILDDDGNFKTLKELIKAVKKYKF